jgi:hypothetical protein
MKYAASWRGIAAAFACAILAGSAGTASIAASETDTDGVVLEFTAADMPRRQVGEKYPDTPGADIVTDAPWRVSRGPQSWIPLLLFVPDANLEDKGFRFDVNPFRGLVLKRITVYANGRPIYNDTDQASPSVGGALVVVNEEGETVSSDIAGGANLCNGLPACDVPKPGGWHRIVRLPTTLFQGVDTVFLKTEIVAVPIYERPLADDVQPYFFSRTLKVHVADRELPSLGSTWTYFDVHMHTIAEWSLGRELTAPRKAFGGPVQMIKESAYAMGLIPSLDRRDFLHRVIATDHNAFFSDAHMIPVGPTSHRHAGFQHDSTRFRHPNGQLEFENMRRIFGSSFGEEVTLQTDYTKEGSNFGSHLLVLRADHFEGPWHGGRLGINWLGKLTGLEPNPNSAEATLATAARFPGAFAYVAHPFAGGNFWTDAKLEVLHDRSRRFITPDQKFVLKGGQYWNEKSFYVLPVESGPRDARVNVVDFFDLHPFEDPFTTPPPRERGFTIKPRYSRLTSDPAWDVDLQKGLVDWHRRIRRLLRFSFLDAPDEIFPRKVYLSGGSDAHGDFNYSTSLLATVLDQSLLRAIGTSFRNVTSNAFARVRTYVDYSDKPGKTVSEKALDALADGNSIATDGPVVAFTFDADMRFDSRTLAWNEAGQPIVFNDDGRVGGHGKFDGGWTALVVKETKHAALRYRWNNSTEFGSRFGGAPAALHLYVDTPQPVDPQTDVELRSPKDKGSNIQVLKPFASFPPGQATRHSIAPLTMQNVSFSTPAAFSMAVFAENNVSGEKFSGYTNPIWIIPVAITVEGDDSGRAGNDRLRVTFNFEMSMKALPYEVRLLPLDEKGQSDSRRAIVLTPDTTFGNGGWGSSVLGGQAARNSVYRVTSSASIDTAASKYRGRFALYLKDPQDPHGNTLNSIATSVELPHR